MTYYFIGERPSIFEEFQNRLPLLEGATYVGDLPHLGNVLKNSKNDDVFFLVLHEISKTEQQLVEFIRENAPNAKIIYFVQEKGGGDLKAHQKSPFGGDAYLPHKAGPEDLNILLEDLCDSQPKEFKNRLEQSKLMKFISFETLDTFKNQTISRELDAIFKSAIQNTSKKPKWQSLDALSTQDIGSEAGVEMSTNEKDLPNDQSIDFDIGVGGEEVAVTETSDEGMDLNFDDDFSIDLASGDEDPSAHAPDVGLGEISLDEVEDLPPGPTEEMAMDPGDDLSFDVNDELNLGAEELDNEGLSLDSEEMLVLGHDNGMSLGNSEVLSLSDEEKSALMNRGSEVLEELDFLNTDESQNQTDDAQTVVRSNVMGRSVSDENDGFELMGEDGEFSEAAQEKLKEIDAIMDYDASRVILQSSLMPKKDEDESSTDDLDQPLVSDDLDLDSLNFDSEGASNEDATIIAHAIKKKREVKPNQKETRDPQLSRDLKELSGAYSGEMERLQATISNLRSDRSELLAKIERLEDERVLQNRQTLSLRAELDEKKIELTIIRKKLHDELNEMKDKFKLFDEKRLILEEKNRQLMQELDKAGHRNRIDVKKVQMRERELEQKLELLKSDAETQIKNRDLKILELKRKMDGMEFDMESITSQEKRSVESRYELEDKLDKAIKTLRNAITVLEDESDRSNALKALKKNIDM